MLSIILGAVWDVVSYNDFQIPRALWQAATTGSAGA